MSLFDFVILSHFSLHLLLLSFLVLQVSSSLVSQLLFELVSSFAGFLAFSFS